MPDTQAEVRIRLVIDDESQATLAKLQEGLKDAHHETDEAGKKAHGLGGELLKANLAAELITKGVELGVEALKEAAESSFEFAKSAAETADEVNAIERGMAGVMQFMDQGEHSFADLRTYAGGLREELEKTGITAGVSTKTMTDTFQQVIERGTISTEKAKELTEQMAMVGKITRGGVEGLSQGFAMVEMGAIRARNPLVQLIASTHTLKGNAHAVAAQLQKMTPSHAMELAQKAIAKQAEMMKSGGGFAMPTGAELSASFGNIREAFMNAVGQPMLDHLIPPLAKLRDYLAAHMDDIIDYGSKIGNVLGGFIDNIRDAVLGIYDGMRFGANYVRTAFDEIFGDWYRAWTQGQTDARDIKKTFLEITDQFLQMAVEFARIIKAAVELVMDANDLLHNRATGTTTAELQRQSVVAGSINTVGGTAAQKEFDAATAKYRQMALEANQIPEEVDRYIEGLRKKHDTEMKIADETRQAVEKANWSTVGVDINNAVTMHREGMLKYDLALLAGSEDSAKALEEVGKNFTGGMDAFVKLLEDQSPELARKLKDLHDPIKAEGGIKPHGAYNDFRNSTFNLKQDFKDQDPNRIALIMRRDILKAAQSRGQSKVASPFGL